MPSWKDFYGSDYLSAKGLGSDTIKGKILTCSPETVGQANGKDKVQLVCELEGQDKRLAINATNAEILAKAYGDNYQKWIGKVIQVTTEPVKFAGRDTEGLRVKPISK